MTIDESLLGVEDNNLEKNLVENKGTGDALPSESDLNAIGDQVLIDQTINLVDLATDLLQDSRISATNNGVHTDDATTTSGQKWWAAVLLGLIFFILSSPAAYAGTTAFTIWLGGMPTAYGGPTIAGLVLHTLIFILVIRLLLW